MRLSGGHIASSVRLQTPTKEKSYEALLFPIPESAEGPLWND